jgi:hypothetical protein
MRMCPTVPTDYLSGRLRFPRRHRFVLPLQPAPQFGRKLVVALLAHRLQVALVELGLLVHLLVADGTGEVVNAPSLVQGGENCNIVVTICRRDPTHLPSPAIT